MQSMSVPFHHKNLFHHALPPPPSTPSAPLRLQASSQHRPLQLTQERMLHVPRDENGGICHQIHHKTGGSLADIARTAIGNSISSSDISGPVPDASVNDYTIDEVVALVLSVLPYVHENAVRARCLDLISDFGGEHHDASDIADEVISLMLA
ncbi:Hypothetical protein, putative [Bodo saltans]|uniref:Uncharacterized protein n=1 Tax=Bodo saltans TaxID=75058 RepID=A0A0S4JM66_BODSA|nr:Hypothetical protein, putative [Bodo saltans]|eukprot:CUG90476.1 Hypothetical protein, putative [Bodo saltans]